MTAMAERIEIISAERVRDELVKLVCAPHPRRGLTLLVETGLAEHVLPELPALALERDEHHRHKDVYEHTLTVLEQSIDLEDRARRRPGLRLPLRRADARRRQAADPALRGGGTVTFHHHDVVGAKLTRKRMKALRFSNDEIDAVVEAGRAAPALPRLRLGRVDRLGRTPLRPRRRRPARAAAHPHPRRLHHPQPAQGRPAAPDVRRRSRSGSHRLSEEEELASIRPDLDGNQIMEILGIGPGPRGGRGLPASCSSCGWTRARRRPRRPRPRCAPGGPPAPS